MCGLAKQVLQGGNNGLRLKSSVVLLYCNPVNFFTKLPALMGEGRCAVAEKAAKILVWHVKRRASNYLVSGFEGVVVVQHRVPHFDFVQLERLRAN